MDPGIRCLMSHSYLEKSKEADRSCWSRREGSSRGSLRAQRWVRWSGLWKVLELSFLKGPFLNECDARAHQRVSHHLSPCHGDSVGIPAT